MLCRGTFGAHGSTLPHARFHGSAGGSVLNLNNGFGQVVTTITSPNSAIGATSIIQLGTATLTVGNSSAASVATFYGSLRGTGGLTKGGASTQILAGANSYTGATNVTKGTLQFGTAATAGALSSSSAIDLTTGGTLALVKITGNTFASSVTSDASGTLLVNSAANNTLSGALTDSGSGQLTFTQSGTGTTILTNSANTYRGLTTITSGTLQVGSATAAGSLGTNANVVVTTGGNLSLVNIAGAITIASTSGTLTLDLANNDTLSNPIADNGHLVATGLLSNNYIVASPISGTAPSPKLAATP